MFQIQANRIQSIIHVQSSKRIGVTDWNQNVLQQVVVGCGTKLVTDHQIACRSNEIQI